MGTTEQSERVANGRGHGDVHWTPPHNEQHADADDVDVKQLAGVIWEARRVVVLIAASVFALMLAVTLFSRMQFSLRGSLYLGDLQTQGGVFEALSSELNPFGGEKGALGTELEILKSRELMVQAILASGLNTELRPIGWSPPRYWRWRLDGRDLGTLEGAWGTVRATATRLTGIRGGSRELEIVFTSDADFEVREDGSSLGVATLGKPFVSPGLELTLVPGPVGPPRAGSRFALEIVSMEDTLEEVSKHFEASAPKATVPGASINVVHLTYTSAAPHKAQLFLNELMRAYLAQNLAWKTEEAEAAETFLTKQLENIQASFDKAGQDLADYKKESTTIVLSEEAKAIIEQMGTFEQQRIEARLQVAALEQVKSSLAKGRAPTEAYLLGEAQDTVLVTMSENLVKTQIEYKRLSEQFTPDYPLVREAKVALDNQLQAIRSYVENRLRRAKEQVSSLDTVIERYEGKLKSLPDAELKLASLTQQTEVYAKLYAFLLERQQQAALTKASTISKSRILDAPMLSYREDSPRLKVRVALGLVAGLLLGVGFVLARWRLSTTFQSEAELRKTFHALPLFASVPRVARSKQRGSNGAPPNPLVLLASDLRSGFAESFRLLRTNLYYSGSIERDKVILIGSSGPSEGKTMTTLCLAGILAADGKRVLVIDGDMRKPSHHLLLGQRQHPGLSSILTGETSWRDTVHDVASPLGEFGAISTGIVPPNPAELLSSPHLRTFLEEARLAFDFVLVDSPPFPLVSDALILAQHADRILSVIRVGASRRRPTHEHVSRVASRRHCGLVFNDVSAGGAYGYGNTDGGYGQLPDSKPERRPKRFGRAHDASGPPEA